MNEKKDAGDTEIGKTKGALSESLDNSAADALPSLPPVVRPNANSTISTSPGLEQLNWRYKLRREIGKGGFGAVFEAWDQVLERVVAVKTPRKEQFSSEDKFESFLDEARLAAGVHHPGIVAIHDVGWADDGRCFIVMEYLAGGTLATLLKRETLSARRCAEIVADIADAIHFANEKGLIHRDLKPSNVLLDASGRPFVADFGLALLQTAPRLTTAQIAGTPQFMAPEQVRGESHRFDARTDVWAIGVMLYFMLTGEYPFSTRNAHEETLDPYLDPIPLRQHDPAISDELERICLRCLRKRMTDRYPSAAHVGSELREWLRQSSGDAGAESKVSKPEPSPPNSSSTVADPSSESVLVIPKGLRSFGSQDAHFFLKLLPGPRDREGLPESIRFWKEGIEADTPEVAFSVGMLYGPSGCGKSSFLKAGLMPRLAKRIQTVYVEATSQNLELRLAKVLQRAFPEMNRDWRLTEILSALRDDILPRLDRKVVVILDQFEQWLHHREDPAAEELVSALRQCDGVWVQCLISVRDDFGMAATRFMDDIEVPIVQGHNFATIDRFSPAHARKVLAEFGRSFGQLTGPADRRSEAQNRFLDEAVAGLVEDHKIVPVRLALFTEMVKDRVWSPQTLRDVGGAEGVGVAFLDETFSARSANPIHRRHHDATERVLRAFLPDHGLQIRGARVPLRELIQVSGYAPQSSDWCELLRILDIELRLITPIESDAPQGDSSRSDSSASSTDPQYQLTHDYLVPVIRSWLTRNQRSTRRGRALLRLTEQAAFWSSRPENRFLPPFWSWIEILLFTRKWEWSPSQRRLMQAATGFYGSRLALALAAIGVLVLAGIGLRNQISRDREILRGKSLVQRLLATDTSEVPPIVEEIPQRRTDIDAELRLAADDPARPIKERTNANLALLAIEPKRGEALFETALDAEPTVCKTISTALSSQSKPFADRCWVESATSKDSPRMVRIGSMLADWSPNDGRWADVAAPLVERLLLEPRSTTRNWSDQLRAAKRWLIPELEKTYFDSKASPAIRATAAAVLADFHDDDLPRLVELLVQSERDQFLELFPAIESRRKEAIPLLRQRLAMPLEGAWAEPIRDPSRPQVSPETVAAIVKAGGVVNEHFAWFQTLRLADFEKIAGDLRSAGYTPNTFRPYRDGDSISVAATWDRSGRNWEVLVDRSSTEIRDHDKACRSKGLVPADIACLDPTTPGQPFRFAALWFEPTKDLIDASLYVDISENEHEQYWRPLNEKNFVPRSNVRSVSPDGVRYSSVRWQFPKRQEYEDRWDSRPDEVPFENLQGWYLADLRHRMEGERPELSVVWWDRGGYDSQANHGLSVESQLLVGNDLATRNWRPFCISVLWDASRKNHLSSTVWRRPVPSESAKDAHARQQANAAVALMRLGNDDLWPLLRHGSDPRLRTWITLLLVPNGVSHRVLWKQFTLEKDVAIRRALLGALSSDRSGNRGWSTAEMVDHLCKTYQTDADPGIRSATGLVLESMGIAKHKSEPELPAGAAHNSRASLGGDWFRTSTGSTFAIVHGPVEFVMGSARNDPHREPYSQTLRRMQIPRSFAIATKEVTVSDFQQYDPDFEFARDYSPEPNCPINRVTLYDAMRYCRWLSELEGVPEDQMCYPAVSEIGENMTLPDHYLERTGYRLPTEAEWEFACRAGSETPRFYGFAPEVLENYAWTAANSDYRAQPVGRLLPNDLGLFDILGNTMEWCQNSEEKFPRGSKDQLIEDLEEPAPFAARSRFVRRGGAFLYEPSVARSSHRDWTRDNSRFPFTGFRVARTWRESN